MLGGKIGLGYVNLSTAGAETVLPAPDMSEISKGKQMKRNVQ